MQCDTLTPSKISIKELSALIRISTTTLRNWEEFFSIPVNRNGLGYREYTENTIRIFRKINSLVKEGLQLKEVKALLTDDFESFKTLHPKTEIIQSAPEEKQNDFELIIKPYENRITELKTLNSELMEENKFLNRENATFAERINNLEARLNRKWWQFGF